MSQTGIHNGTTEKVRQYLKSSGVDLHKRLPTGLTREIAETIGDTPRKISRAISRIRMMNHIRTPITITSRRMTKTYDNAIRRYCLDNGLLRGAPNSERYACTKFCYALMNFIPPGGAGMIIGTPTMVCASESKTNKMIHTDNFEVATILKWTTSVPITIVIGNKVNPEKAYIKGNDWRSNNTTNDAQIIVTKVDAPILEMYTSQLCETLPLVKVLLMNSGIWECCASTQRSYNFDCRFRDTSMRLVNKYDNLHLLAMALKNGKKFDVHYLHNGKDTII